VDVVIGALAKIVPQKVCACDGHWSSGTFVGLDPRTGRYSAYLETYACGRGAKYNDDGADAHQTHLTNSANAPIEIIELEHPLKVEKYALIPDSGGVGKFRGGIGITREITAMAEMAASALSNRPTIGTYGLFGGGSGSTDYCMIELSNGATVKSSKNVKSGEKLVIRSSGGGGWGNPLERDIAKVEWDVLNGYVSVAAAEQFYKVVIDPVTYKADRAKTAKLRGI
jgi:N-methylhydantoinase B